MKQTLFYIPLEIGGYPLFGLGILLAVWAVVSIMVLATLVRRHGWTSETLGYIPLLGLIGLVIAVVLPAISETPGLPIRGYGVMLLLALVASVGLALFRAKRRGLDPELINSLGLWLITSGIAGARIFYIVEYPQQYFHGNWRETLAAIVNLAQGGLVVYGSIFGGGLALIVFVYRHRLPGLALADLVIPSVLLGVAIGRLGCFLNGCCYGGACELPWAVEFPFGSPPHVRQVQEGSIYLHGLKFKAGPRGETVIAAVEPGSEAAHAGVTVGQRVVEVGGLPVTSVADAEGLLLRAGAAGESISLITADSPRPKSWTLRASETSSPIHPAQLYSTIDGLLICLFLLAYDPFKRRDGELLAWAATIYPITRFLMEIIRTDEGPVFGTTLSISQNISLLILAGVAIFWWYLSRQPRTIAWPVQATQRPTAIVKRAAYSPT
jgi:phosphatidylglycerol:prolipoprotein diacylglycerol transferase